MHTKIVREYDQEIPQLPAADKPVASRGKATQQSRDTFVCLVLNDASTLVGHLRKTALN